MTILVVYSFTMLIIGIIALTRSGLKKVFHVSDSEKVELRNMKAPDSDAHVSSCHYYRDSKTYCAVVYNRTGSYPTLKEDLDWWLYSDTKEGLEEKVDEFYKKDSEAYAIRKRFEED